MLIQVCASLADSRVKQSEVRSLSEAMVELAVAEGTIVTWRADEEIPVGFGTIQVVPVWRFLLDLPHHSWCESAFASGRNRTNDRQL